MLESEYEHTYGLATCGDEGKCIYCGVDEDDATSIICPELQPWWDKVLDWVLRRR